MSIKEVQERHGRMIHQDTGDITQDDLDLDWVLDIMDAFNDAHKDRGELLDALKRANDMINNSYQCECGNPKAPCPCLEGFLDNIQAILAGV